MATKKSGKKDKEEQAAYEAELWFKRIDASKKSNECLIDECEDNVKLYNGEIINSESTGYSKNKNVDVNLLYVDMKQSVSSQYGKNPKIFFEPEIPEAEWSASVYEIAINQLWRKLKMKELMRDGVKSAKLNAIAVFKTYFNFSTDFHKDEWTDRIQNDEVRTDRINIKNIYYDSDSDNPMKSDWIGHEIVLPLKTIIKKFDLSEDEAIKVKIVRETGNVDYGSGAIDDEFKYGCFYEIEDRKNKKLFCLVRGIEKKFDEKDSEMPYDTMYDFLMYNDIPDTSEIHSDVYFWKKQLREVCLYRTMLSNHAKKGTAKYKAIGNDLTEDQKAQLKTSIDSSVLQLSAGQDVTAFQHSSIDPLILQAEAAARADIQLISKQAIRQSPNKKTATEVNAVEAAAQDIESENLERLEEVMASIATKWAKLIQKNYTTERVIKLTEVSDAEFLGFKNSIGDENITGTAKKGYLKFDNKNLSERVCANIEAGSTLPDNDQTRMQKFLGFAKFISSVPGAAAALDIEEVVKEAEEVFGVRGMNLLKKKEDPVSESKLLNAGILIAAKLGENHDMHLEVHEKEDNGNYQNALHIQMHKEFKSQMLKNEEAQKSTMNVGGLAPLLQALATGKSFQGASPLAGPPGMPPPAMPGMAAQPQAIPPMASGIMPRG